MYHILGRAGGGAGHKKAVTGFVLDSRLEGGALLMYPSPDWRSSHGYYMPVFSVKVPG